MMNRPIPESYWVEPNRFLAGEYPGGFNDLARMRRRIDGFLETGIDTFIDLTYSTELVPYEAVLRDQARTYGIEATYNRFPIRDHSIPTRAIMTAILSFIDVSLNAGRNLYVHCWGGVGRTGMIVGCYLIHQGRSNEEALMRVAEWFRFMPKHVYFPTSPETEEQIQFVRDWRGVTNPIDPPQPDHHRP